MKKLLFSVMALSAVTSYGQSKLNIFNYTAYNLSNYLVGSNQANNCYPNISGTSYPVMVPPSGAVVYNGYYNSYLQSPSITSWSVQLSAGGSTTSQPSSSGLLITLGTATRWQMNKFFVDDPSGAPLYYSGASIGTISCNSTPILNLTPSATTPYPFDAFWFEVGNDTYFVIQ